jgi:cholesterol oxidase
MSTDTADVIVIGSGFGGSITANRLSRAGKKVLVLERGPWRDTLPVRSMGIEERSPLPIGMKAITHGIRTLHHGGCSLTLNKRGLFEIFSTPGLYVLAASGVGGGSIPWGGLLEAPRDDDYWRNRHPELRAEDVEKHYSRVLSDLGAFAFQRDSAGPQSVWDHLPDSGQASCRVARQHPHMAFLLPDSPADIGQVQEFPGGLRRQASTYNGDSMLGSPGGTKASVDFVYLAPVLGQGAIVRALCEVSEITPRSTTEGGGYRVHFKDLATGETESACAGKIVLAAGTMNTLRLLFASSEGNGGLAAMPALGRNFGANGDLIGAWRRKQQPYSSFDGLPCLGGFEVAGHPGPELAISSMAGFDTLPLPKWAKRKLSEIYLMFGIGKDSGKASVSYKKGKLVVDYDQAKEPIFAEIRSAFGQLEAQSGDKTWALRTPLTPHQWGGASVGADASCGVTNHQGEIFNNPGLFLADGSALPAAPGGPPALTIAAWAHHVADSIAQADSSSILHRAG